MRSARSPARLAGRCRTWRARRVGAVAALATAAVVRPPPLLHCYWALLIVRAAAAARDSARGCARSRRTSTARRSGCSASSLRSSTARHGLRCRTRLVAQEAFRLLHPGFVSSNGHQTRSAAHCFGVVLGSVSSTPMSVSAPMRLPATAPAPAPVRPPRSARRRKWHRPPEWRAPSG